MMHTVKLSTIAHAEYLRDCPELAGNGHVVDIDGTEAALSSDALEVLADFPGDADGHYDGQYIWIGGSEYEVS